MLAQTDQARDYLIRQFRRKLLHWGQGNFSDFPWRHENNLFHALVAEILLQRTRAEQVVVVYKEFREAFPDPITLGQVELSRIEKVISPLGLKWRARFLSTLGGRLSEMGGQIPDDIKLLQSLPGVGPYAAAAFLSLHAGKRAPVIDSNIVRLYGRFFGFETGPETRRKKEILQLAERVTPNKNFRDFNYALIDFTRTVCRPKPVHSYCPISDKCCFYISLSKSEFDTF
ncbi:A/G-specific adenine glycosylase [Chloroflexota bacterium]